MKDFLLKYFDKNIVDIVLNSKKYKRFIFKKKIWENKITLIGPSYSDVWLNPEYAGKP